MGNFEVALDIYNKVIASRPEFEQPYLSRGHAQKTIGQLDQAIESYRAAYRARADFGDDYWSLANLKTYKLSDADIGVSRWGPPLKHAKIFRYPSAITSRATD